MNDASHGFGLGKDNVPIVAVIAACGKGWAWRPPARDGGRIRRSRP